MTMMMMSRSAQEGGGEGGTVEKDTSKPSHSEEKQPPDIRPADARIGVIGLDPFLDWRLIQCQAA